MQLMLESSETNEGQCMFAYDVFNTLERIILDYVPEPTDRAKFLDDLKTARSLYRERIMTEMFNAYMDEPLAIRKDVMSYVNMIIGIDAENLGPDKMWKYKNPQTGELQALKVDERFIKSIEERLQLKTDEQRESFRTSIRKIYGQKIGVDPNYDFMDNNDLVKAVTDVRLKSDVAGAGSLVGALSNRTNEENQKLYDRMIDTMLNKLGYCKTCAQKTIEYFWQIDRQSGSVLGRGGWNGVPVTTPFLRAAQSGDLELIELLLAHGADPALATDDGVTPLMVAAGFGTCSSISRQVTISKLPGCSLATCSAVIC